MELILNPQRSAWSALCARPSDSNPVIRERVEKIIGRVREGGDAEIKALAAEIDGRAPETLKVSRKRIEEAAAKVSPEVKRGDTSCRG